jgi:eukaryotic-like serine/threonine-protein kinase
MRSAEGVGRRIGGWHLDALIGEGGMASVYAASRDGQRAALKLLHREHAYDDELRERFIREGEIARSVEHPGCVRVFHDDVSEEGEPYLVMELLEGRTLAELWLARNKRLPVEWVLHVAARVLDVLGALHDVGVVHRDVKPSNVFVLRDGNVKLLDFGVARQEREGREQTRAGLALGTPAYMAPEQAMGKVEDVDARSDVFALGAMLYTLLSGARLHEARSEQEAYVLAATQPAASISRVAPHLAVPVVALVDKALQWDRRNRFQTAAEMRAAIAEYLWQASREKEAAAAEGPAIEAPAIELAIEAPPPSSRRAAVVGRAQEASEPAPPSMPSVVLASMPAGAAVRRQGPAGATEELPLDPAHPLAPFFVHLDRLLRTARQYGPAHPETLARLPPVYRAVQDALAIDVVVRFAVQPFCFAHDGAIAWEPAPPGDLVPYTLSVAGLRELRVRQGVTEAELRELLGAFMIDANTRAADVATALWEASLPHVDCRLEEEIAGGDAQALEELSRETADLEDALTSDLAKLAASLERAELVEANAAAAMTRVGAGTSQLLAPDEADVAVLARGLHVDEAELAERHALLLVDALADVAERDDRHELADALAAYAGRRLQLGRYDEIFATHARLLERAHGTVGAAELTAAFFPDGILAQLARAASAFRGDPAARAIVAGLEAVLAATGPERLGFVAGLVPRVEDEATRAAMVGYLVRASEGREEELMRELEGLDPLVTQRVLAQLLLRGGQAMRALLETQRQSSNSALRCEAIAQLAASPVELAQELIELFQSSDEAVRRAALETFIRHGVRSAGPALVRVVEQEGFTSRSLDEQQRVFEALHALNPSRTEALLGEVVGRHGLTADEVLDQTRTLAVRLLGEWGASEAALEAARQASRRRWWNTAPLREVAVQAAAAIAARVAAGGEP